MRKGPLADVMERSVARLSRRAKSGRVTHPGRSVCHARLVLRFRRVTLPAPREAEEEPVKVSAIHLHEVSPPEAPHIEWYLLTTMAVTTREEAKQMVEHYTLRWRVEDIFRILKSGCRVEKLRLQQAASWHQAITLYLVTTWRTMLMTLLGRVLADLEAELIFTDTELQVN